MTTARFSVVQCPIRSLSYVEFLTAVEASMLNDSGRYRSRYFALLGELTRAHDITADTMIDRVPWQDSCEHPALYGRFELTFHGPLIDYMQERLGQEIKCVAQLSEGVPYAALQRHEIVAVERLAAWVLLYVDMPALYDIAPDLRPRLSGAPAA